ncbi:MAG: hypothetical protein R3F11_18585 [Verrucomicrobiales bacterium]
MALEEPGLIASCGLKEMWKRMLIENPEYDAQNIRVASDGSMLREILREASADRGQPPPCSTSSTCASGWRRSPDQPRRCRPPPAELLSISVSERRRSPGCAAARWGSSNTRRRATSST